MVEGFARVYELVVSFITLSGARALDGGLRTSVLYLLSLVLDNFIIRFGSISGKAGSALGQIFRRLQGKQILLGPSKQRLLDQSRKGGGGLGPGPTSSPQRLGSPGREASAPTSTTLGA
jgi:hypothetical protein